MRQVFIGLVIGVAGFAVLAVAQSPTTPPLFTVGDRLLMARDCLPEIVIPPGVNPCYVEAMTVRQVRPDGWLVVDMAGEPPSRWTINPARASAFKVFPPEGQRAAR